MPLTMLLTGTLAFLAVAADLHFHGLLQQCDLPLRQWFHNHAHPLGIILFSAISYSGQFEVLGPIAVVVAAWLLYKRRYFATGIWAIALLGSVLINESLKSFFKVPRPDRYTYFVWTNAHPGYSFPSGHTMGVAITAGTLALLARHLGLISPKKFPRAAAAVIALTLTVAFALMYMGVHSLTDILAALAISIAWLGAITLMLRRAPRPPAAPDSPIH